MTGKHDPFKIDGPTCLSFSGGRTSAYMLWRVIQANTPEDLARWLVVVFANTGQEDEATLKFVRDCALHWGIRVIWLQYVSKLTAPFYELVSFETASRDGTPLERAFDEHDVLPNPVARYCTAETKIRTITRYYGADQDPRLEGPLHTVTTKHRFGLVTVEGEPYAIVDIGLRMLTPRELYRAQGFPESYAISEGVDPFTGERFTLTKTAQVRMCGNSVCPPLARAIVAANYTERVIVAEAA